MMNISGVSAAANYAAVQPSRLTQLFSGLVVKQGGSISDAMAGLLQKTMDGYMQSFLDRLDSQLSANLADWSQYEHS